MKKADTVLGRVVTGFAAICLTGASLVLYANAAPGIAQGFDSDGEKIFNRFNETPLPAMTGTDGKRTLNTYYQLRQYPGSPPRVPHDVPTSFSGDTLKCLSCHGKGGYDITQEAYAPVTPHPEYENCFQCHVPRLTEELFVETDWQSINPPPLGRSEMGGSPPPIIHSLQLREDCIACHTGNAAVAEIRVEHASRGNCRQCHVPMIATEPREEFIRNN
ncbi:nitrate reductase cytochrome c-type subunit [Desulfocapsa sulfexigens DSM 10523]|uniref:Nitrate reductase cytochrome c-type subunit n=1 Tax=Desulfocapsa sulfexigens (strain DSM 10523 / SB164P1) TaxID=1167006 RepID=M1NJQ9_DESSD|nr:nitrate reductase cytochrome c-type subunit [Desulfocapsa sulfexigens]AGF79814.1 nitrate reductase cytochrome c-type subunit [Desulfocapsa sulfexigens DSM 10523]